MTDSDGTAGTVLPVAGTVLFILFSLARLSASQEIRNDTRSVVGEIAKYRRSRLS